MLEDTMRMDEKERKPELMLCKNLVQEDRKSEGLVLGTS